jgi:hypothetical protein
MNLEQIADVLEKAATYVEAIESTKADAVAHDRQKLASILNERYEEATGESLDDEALHKLAGADLDVLAAFDKLAESHSSVSDLGGPSDRHDRSASLTVKEASDKADEDFLNFIVS